MSTPTHILTVRSRSGRRINPLTLGSSDFCTCYGLVDLAARLAKAAKDPDIEVTVRPYGEAAA